MSAGSHHLLVFYRPGGSPQPMSTCSGLEFTSGPYGSQTPDAVVNARKPRLTVRNARDGEIGPAVKGKIMAELRTSPESTRLFTAVRDDQVEGFISTHSDWAARS